ncbi:MAG: Gfo/Idh/MocA family oxidoreductase [Planctomycetia bacterium]|nr:Gfo/Idh/MocA family oxidoreductase [Planctomycetia bacterium]
MSNSKIRVGVIGLGMMGLTHLDVYSKLPGVEIAAIADINIHRLSGEEKASGNIEGQAQGGIDFSTIKKYKEGFDLIADPEIDLVDVCLPTMMHAQYAVAALKADKHLLLEKPMARTYDECVQILEAAVTAKGFAMPAMCIRFWPGYDWLKHAVENNTYGKVYSAQFYRLSSHPGPMYLDGDKTGGAALDLHIHDADFVRYVFGNPESVTCAGYKKLTNHYDHVKAGYNYKDVPLVTAEGAWCMQPGFPFTMAYTVNFENATAIFNNGVLKLCQNGEEKNIELSQQMGYAIEIAYFVECIQKNTPPTLVTLKEAAESVRLIETECRSMDEKGAVIKF